ncbi:hypothetical protein B0T16DRAFT_28881 [Cercophora newfieldiana]|uniref:C2H2-type domain-containing protein n=1 Tax=Cercophora newfieldiana TaxID=92897 RepID=A0AA40D0J5_9PEZI|nr:hypothetical protein B0T16DRAFT_28881 [Cercophora newfieldiana]
MDGSFDGSNCFPGDRNGYHRHTQSGNISHMGFSTLMQPPTIPSSAQPSAGGLSRLPNGAGSATYESHDDMCIDQCSGVGLYNGSFFNHRSAVPTTRWPNRTMSTHHNPGSLLGFAAELDVMQFRHELTQSNQDQYQESWYGQHFQQGVDRDLHRGDEDASSAETDSCCDSQCTMTGKCSNIACANNRDICTDQDCPGRSTDSSALPSEVVNTAEALLSINHGPGQQHHAFSLQGSGESQMDSLLSFNTAADHQDSAMDGFNFNFPQASNHQFVWPPVINSVANHLLVAHGDPNSSNCTRPCLLDDPRNYPNCRMPIYNNLNFDAQYGSLNSELQLNQNLIMCKAEVHDPETYLEHFNQQHREFFASNVHQPLLNTVAMQHTGVMHSIEAMSSSPTTPLDGLESPDSDDSSNTPSPLTPMSNSVDMSEFKAEVSSPPERSMSVVSEDPHVHRCMWREEGSEDICGLVFPGPEELFNHASNTHIKNAKKGDQGFRCGWDDCPRSEVGAAGFPQRSKIERHMQTHIDHKPHVCHICNKGFSAKQALNQHMFIHTNQKPLVCNICGKAFRYPSALTMHQRVHSGEKPLSCPICGKSFSESSNLSKHKRTHEVRGRFSCRVPGCDRNFHRQDQLRRHMKTHQKEGENGQVDCMLASQLETAFEQHAHD